MNAPNLSGMPSPAGPSNPANASLMRRVRWCGPVADRLFAPPWTASELPAWRAMLRDPAALGEDRWQSVTGGTAADADDRPAARRDGPDDGSEPEASMRDAHGGASRGGVPGFDGAAALRANSGAGTPSDAAGAALAAVARGRASSAFESALTGVRPRATAARDPAPPFESAWPRFGADPIEPPRTVATPRRSTGIGDGPGHAGDGSAAPRAATAALHRAASGEADALTRDIRPPQDTAAPGPLPPAPRREDAPPPVRLVQGAAGLGRLLSLVPRVDAPRRATDSEATASTRAFGRTADPAGTGASLPTASTGVPAPHPIDIDPPRAPATADTRPNRPPAPTVDVDGLLDALVERLRVDYLRHYGSAG